MFYLIHDDLLVGQYKLKLQGSAGYVLYDLRWSGWPRYRKCIPFEIKCYNTSTYTWKTVWYLNDTGTHTLISKYQHIFFFFLGIKYSQTVINLFSFWPFSILFRAHNLQNDVIKWTHNIDKILQYEYLFLENCLIFKRYWHPYFDK